MATYEPESLLSPVAESAGSWILDFPASASLVAQLVKKPPAVRETWVQSLGWKDLWVGEGKGNPLQYSGLENSMDCIVHGFAESQTRLSNSHFHFQVNL